MELNIKKVNNGFILTHKENWSSDDKEDIRDIQEVITDNEYDEKETIKELLEYIADFFGVSNDRYGKNNLNILFNKKGSKI